jgi:trans-aconitate 2-methyltransferase
MPADAWNVAQYERFKAERDAPFFDLLDLVEPRPAMRVVDLGCGTGELTAILHERLGAAETLGLDSSPSMLAKAAPREGLRFEHGDIAEFASEGQWDLVFSNAALQWVPGHEGLFVALRRALRPGGQLAVQMPKNFDHPAHTLAYEMGAEPPYGVPPPARPAMEPEEYTLLLHRLGFEAVRVRLHVYLHLLESRESVVEWVRGTLLTRYQSALAPGSFERFLREYRERLMERLEDERPYPFTFKRLMMHARLPD